MPSSLNFIFHFLLRSILERGGCSGVTGRGSAGIYDQTRECWLSCGEKSLPGEAPGLSNLCRLAGINPTAHDTDSHRWDTRHQN